MDDTALIVVGEAPAAVVAGSGLDYGSVDLNTLLGVLNDSQAAFVRAEKAEDIDTLREVVKDLADAVARLNGEVYQIAAGISHRRISAVPLGS